MIFDKKRRESDPEALTTIAKKPIKKNDDQICVAQPVSAGLSISHVCAPQHIITMVT